MTVHYASKFADNSRFGSFTTLLFRWRGSVYKLVWHSYLVFIALYFVLSMVYRFCLPRDYQKQIFEKIAIYCDRSTTLSLSFVLGFFVQNIVGKWWQLYWTIPRPHTIAFFINANIRGQDESTLELKRTIVRYCNLNLMLNCRTVSAPLKEKYPTLDHLVEAGFLLESEKLTLEMVTKETKYSITWLPIIWATNLVEEAHAEGKIVSNVACQRIIDELARFRGGGADLTSFEFFTVPLVYVQVVTIAVYSYFLYSLMGRQWVLRNRHIEKWLDSDFYFPIFTSLEFILYMGWLKVAESVINPFGCDDEDFELLDIINRNREVPVMIVGGKKQPRLPVTESLVPWSKQHGR